MIIGFFDFLLTPALLARQRISNYDAPPFKAGGITYNYNLTKHNHYVVYFVRPLNVDHSYLRKKKGAIAGSMVAPFFLSKGDIINKKEI